MGNNKAGNMAHIADLMVGPASSVGLNNYIARELSPHPPGDSMSETTAADEKGKEKFIWRMHQPSEARKYQLFPAKDKLSITPGRNSPDPEQAFALAMSQSSHNTDRPIMGAAMRLKAKEVSLLRRRKPSVSDLGPMTTVQEIAMDSPTIPGRPPLHERSISAPGHNTWRRNPLAESMLCGMSGPALDESAENNTVDAALKPLRRRSGSPKGLLSPKFLAPLVIPPSTGPKPQRIVAKMPSLSTLESPNGSPPTVPPKSARMLEDKISPQSRTPFTPLSSSTYTPLTSATTTNLSIPSTATPISATDGRASPFYTGSATRGPSPMGHMRGQSDTGSDRYASVVGHRRELSEASVMDRGRPKRRPDGSPIKIKRSLSKRSQIAEQKAFETLPEGVKATDALNRIDHEEIIAIKKQAIGQAAKFEVLAMKDVESLSRELRGLDERCEYLRKTHHSLRSGRRNLHERICTYLRSPRTAQFSHASILKQEETLIELDQSIDDWVAKLEQAENRRTRVRQKLLEHVAAALTVPNTRRGLLGMKGGNITDGSSAEAQDQLMMTNIALNRHISMGEDTPPRSPTKEQTRVASPNGSPQRLALPIQAQTQSMHGYDDASRMSKESIRIYADSDVYALLADVEEEMNRMGAVQEESQELLSAVSFSGPVPSRTASPMVH